MIEKILQFSKENFYRNKSEQIASAVKGYADLKQNGAPEDEILTSKYQAEEVLTGMMVENDFADEETAYVSLEKEFFNQEGELDDKKLENFQKTMIRHYAKEQIRWSFAGTTSCFTPISIKSMKQNNIEYTDLLPAELKKEYREKKKQTYMEKKPGTFTSFLYQDGTVSGEVIPEKKKVHFDILKDTSGFNWEAGYSPNNVVNKENWEVGFNESGEWEKINSSETIRYSSDQEINPVSLLTETGGNGDIGVFSFEDMSFLFDNLSLLMDGEEETFYSLSGDLYGRREMDQAKSLGRLVNNLKQRRIALLNGVVIRDATNEAVAFYKKILADFITPETKFYSRTDKELRAKLTDLKEEIIGKEISGNILSGFVSVSKNVLKGDELYRKLTPSTIESTYDVPLHIFDSEEDMLSFISLPEISGSIDEEAVEFLKKSNIPVEKKHAYSNAVQNILHNYKKLFKHTNLPQVDVLKSALGILLNKETPFAKENITSEKNLYEFIKAGSKSGKKVDIPSFKQSLKKEGDYYNLEDPGELTEWIDKELIGKLPDNATAQIKEIIEKTQIAPGHRRSYSRAVQDVLEEYQAIAHSTGMRPAEIVNAVKAVLTNKPGSIALKKKRIFFEKKLEDLVKEASLDNPYRIKVLKKDLYNKERPRLIWKPFDSTPNLLSAGDRKAFIESPLIGESGLTSTDGREIEKYLEGLILPTGIQLPFSQAVMKTIRGYNYKLKPAGINLTGALKAIESLVTGKKCKLEAEALSLVRSVSGLHIPGVEEISPVRFREELDSLTEGNPDIFLSIPAVSASGISREEVENLQTYLKNDSTGRTVKNAAVVQQVLSGYKNHIKPTGMNPVEVVKAIDNINKGGSANISPVMNNIVNSILVKKLSSSPITEANGGAGELLYGDLNTFAASPLVAGNGLDAGEAASLHKYLKRAKVPEGKKTQFSRVVYNLLKDYKSQVSSSGLTPLQSVQAAASALRGNTKSIPPQIKPFFEKLINNAAELPAIGDSGLNLLKPADFENFISSGTFKNSGLDREQLSGLIDDHRSAYQGMKKNYYQSVPVNFKSQDEVGDLTKDLVNMPANNSSNQENSVYNLGLVQRSVGDQFSSVNFTPRGRDNFSPGFKRNIMSLLQSPGTNMKSGISPVQSGSNRIDTPGAQDLPFFNDEVVKNPPVKNIIKELPVVNINLPGMDSMNSQQMTGTGDNSMMFTHPSTYLKQSKIKSRGINEQGIFNSRNDIPGGSGQIFNQPQANNVTNNILTSPPVNKRSNSESEKLKRIEQNYLNDKRMLARSKSHSPLTGPSQGGKGKDEGNVIKKTAEDIIAEMKSEMGDYNL